jgi:hypothetical protein
MNMYKAFGLTIASEIVLDELLPYSSEKSDITIRQGSVPDAFEDMVVNKENRKIGRDKFILDIKGVSKFYVEKGSLIVLEQYENALFEEVKLYLLGSCMGALLYQRRVLPLHGSCINMDGRGIMLTGDSGAGKSTIASALLGRGCSIVTDDVAAMGGNESGDPIVYPGYPSQKLWEDAIERIGREEQKYSLIRVSNELNKYSVSSRHCFSENPVQLKAIFEIKPAEVDEIRIEEVPGVEKLDVILKNTYRRFLTRAMHIRDWHFSQCVEIAKKVEVFRIIRPQKVHLEQEIADRICGKYDINKSNVFPNGKGREE